jgi:hypothetical protein
MAARDYLMGWLSLRLSYQGAVDPALLDDVGTPHTEFARLRVNREVHDQFCRPAAALEQEAHL